TDAIVDRLQATHVDFNVFWDVPGQAADAEAVDVLLQLAVTAQDRGRLAHQDNGHVGGDLLFEVDLVEVDMDNRVGARVVLDLPHEDLARAALAVDLEVQELGAADPVEGALELPAR